MGDVARSVQEPVGMVGVGQVGGAIASRLLSRGCPVTAFDRSRAALDRLVTGGGRAAASPGDVARTCATTLIVVMDDAQVRELAPELLGAAAPGDAVVVVSTVRPDTCRELGTAAAARGVLLVDAPVTGGAGRAVAGELTTLVGGETAAVESVRPVLEAYSSRVIHLGPLGCGQVGKLANNVMSLANTVVIAEALAMAEASGLDAEAVIDVALSGSGASNALITWSSRRDLVTPGSDPRRRPIALKDLELALELAAAHGVDLPVTAAAAAALRRLVDAHSAPA